MYLLILLHLYEPSQSQELQTPYKDENLAIAVAEAQVAKIAAKGIDAYHNWNDDFRLSVVKLENGMKVKDSEIVWDSVKISYAQAIELYNKVKITL